MLTKESIMILDFLIHEFSEDKSMIDYNSIVLNTSLPYIEIDSALQYLESDGYLSVKRYKNGGFVHKLTHKALHYKDFEAVKNNASTQTNIFNAPVSNSAIGNTANVTINTGITFAEALAYIQSQDIPQDDKDEANRVIEYIETLTENEAPLKKGFLSKFSDVLAKNSWLPELALKLVFSYFMGQSL